MKLFFTRIIGRNSFNNSSWFFNCFFLKKIAIPNQFLPNFLTWSIQTRNLKTPIKLKNPDFFKSRFLLWPRRDDFMNPNRRLIPNIEPQTAIAVPVFSSVIVLQNCILKTPSNEKPRLFQVEVLFVTPEGF